MMALGAVLGFNWLFNYDALWEACCDSSGTRTSIVVPPIGFDSIAIASIHQIGRVPACW